MDCENGEGSHSFLMRCQLQCDFDRLRRATRDIAVPVLDTRRRLAPTTVLRFERLSVGVFGTHGRAYPHQRSRVLLFVFLRFFFTAHLSIIIEYILLSTISFVSRLSVRLITGVVASVAVSPVSAGFPTRRAHRLRSHGAVFRPCCSSPSLSLRPFSSRAFTYTPNFSSLTFPSPKCPYVSERIWFYALPGVFIYVHQALPPISQ